MTTCTAALADLFAGNREKIALVSEARNWTYADLAFAAQQLATEWRRRGAISGDRVFITPGDRTACLIAILAASYGGYELILPSQRATTDELRAVSEATRPRVVWSAEDTPTDAAPARMPLFDGFTNARMVFFTSGATSRPKGVCHTLEALLANADAFNRRAGLSSNVRMLHVMPSGYMAGVLNTFLSPLMAGGTVVLGDAFSTRGALQFWKLARRESVNAVWLSPTMTATITQLSRGEELVDWARRHLRHVFVGTAPLHPTTRRAFFEKLGVDCLESYGMTECMFVSVNPPDIPNPRDSVGLLLDGVEAQARGVDGLPLPPGREGPLWLRSPFVMEGYLDVESAELSRMLDPDGWLDTGDIGIVDEEGRLTITGRLKDLIIRGGVNVSPRAVEDVILDFPGVLDAAVFGSPHPFWGEEVIACVVAADTGSLDMAGLQRHCSQRLPPDAVPARFVPWADFPRSGNGKIQKQLLRQVWQQSRS